MDRSGPAVTPPGGAPSRAVGQGAGRRRGRFRVGWSVILWPSALLSVLFLALFYFYPLASILGVSLAPQGTIDLRAFSELLSRPHLARVIFFTFWQAVLSTLVTLLLALPAAYVFARFRFPGKGLLQALTTVPFVLPTVVVALALTSLLGPRGYVNTLLMRMLRLDEPLLDLQYTLSAILIAHVFYNFAVVLRMVGGHWANLDPKLRDSARMLGASPWRAFRHVVAPLMMPSVMAAAVLVFLFCFTSFGVVLILGGPRFATIEVEIYRQTVQFLNLPVAAALSVVQILITALLMVTYTRLQARLSRPLDLLSRQATQRMPRRPAEWALVVACVILMGSVLLVPLGALAWRSLTLLGRLTLEPYGQLLTRTRQSVLPVAPAVAIRNSVAFALATVVLSLVVGATVALVQTRRQEKLRPIRHWIDVAFMLPLGTSAVTLGLGYIIALDAPPLDFRTSPILVVLAHTLIALPFVVRSATPALRAISPRLREAASSLGATPARVMLHVDMPIVSRAMAVGAVFAFTVSMGEFGATSLIARPDYPTIPIAIYRLLSRPGAINYGQALAMSTLLMLVCTVGFLAIEGVRFGPRGEF